MGASSLLSVVVVTRPAGADRTADREALLAAVADAAGVDVARVRAGRVCANCGSTAHGRPWARVDDHEVGVSLARTPGVVVLAVGPVGIGVDVERVSRVTAADLDVFTPGERHRADGAGAVLAASWAGKEAVLKRDGRGLRVDPALVDVDVARGTAVFEGHEQPVAFARPEPDVVVAVATGGAAVTWAG